MYLLRWADDAPELLPKLVLLRGGPLVSRTAFLPAASVFMAARRFPARRAYSVKTEAQRTIRRLQNRSSSIVEPVVSLTPHDLRAHTKPSQPIKLRSARSPTPAQRRTASP